MMAWLAMMVASVARITSGTSSRCWAHQVEDVAGEGRAVDHQRRLPGVGNDERGQHHGEPGLPNGLGPEMSHVGVQRFRPGHAEEDAAQHQEAAHAVMQQVVEPVERIDRGEDGRVMKDAGQAHQRDGGEPERP